MWANHAMFHQKIKIKLRKNIRKYIQKKDFIILFEENIISD